MYYLLLFLVFFFGISIGSFLNVVVYRLKSGESIAIDRSKCRDCKHVLSFLDLVPLLSFVYLKGKCRYCKAQVAYQYPAVELATGLLFVLIFALKGGIDFSLTFDIAYLIPVALYWLYTAFLMVIFVYDLKYYLILNKVLLPAALVALLGSVFLFGADIHQAFLGSMLFGFFMLFLFVISSGRWIGGGDVKLAFVLGLMLGFPHVIAAFFISYIGGALVAVVLIVFGKKKLGEKVPFGTFLTAGTVVSFFVAEPMIQWYIAILGFK